MFNGGVPWCAECDRYLTPPAVNTDGTCPTCGRAVDVAAPAPVAAGAGAAGAEPTADEELPVVPWHFKVLCVGVTVYLGYRFVQLGEWLIHKL